MFLLVSGQLQVTVGPKQNARVFATLGPGEMFGEMAFLTRKPRAATVRASEDSRCLVLKAAELRLFGYRHPRVFLQVARVLADRLQRAGQLGVIESA